MTSFEVRASQVVAGLPRVLRRVPFTVAVVAGQLAIGLVTLTLWVPLWGAEWFTQVAYGVPALREGRLWTFVTGPFFGLTPGRLVFGMALFAVLVGACELRLGTRRVAVAVVSGQVGGALAASLLVWLLSTTGWTWAVDLAYARDVGFTTGALTAVAVTSAALRSPWRLRVRVVLWFSVTVAFLFQGTLPDVAHAVAVGVGLVVGQRVFGVEPGFGPRTRAETRMIAFAGLAMVLLVQVVVLLFPGRGPFGATSGTATPFVDVVVDLVVIGFVANQLRHGKRWAWWVTVVLGALNLLVAVLALALIIAGLLPDGAPIALGGGVLWVGELAFLLVNHGAFRVPARRRLPSGALSHDVTDRVRRTLTAVGGTTTSWMTTWPENQYHFTADGRGYVAFQRHAGVAIALADPVVPAGGLADAIAEFAATSEEGGLVPCLFSISDAAAGAARAAGWRTAQVAEDAIVDLPDLAFKGRKWQDVRTAINRAQREGLAFRLVRLADEPTTVLSQVRAISEQWVGDKGLPEMGFTLGGVEEALDPAVLVGLASDMWGTVHGVTSWLPVHAAGGRIRGWTLDVMRRREDGFRPVVEFMIGSACQALRARGADFVSLSGAPLARSGATSPAEGVDLLLDTLGGALEPLYGFRSLHAFKAKFSPRYEPLHLAFRDEADLPRIGVALVRAYLPHTTARQLLASARSAR